MRPAWKRWLYRIGLLVGGLLLGLQIWLAFQSLHTSALRIVAPSFLLWATAAVAAATLVQITAWQAIMAGLGVGVERLQLARGYVLPFIARFIPGSVWGYLGRSEWMHHNHLVPYDKTNVASAFEVLSVLTAAFMVICLFLDGLATGLGRIGLAGLAVLVSPLIWYGLRSAFMNRIFVRLPFGKQYAGTLAALSLPRWLSVNGLHILVWLCYGVSVRLVVSAIAGGYMPALMSTTVAFVLAWLVGFFVVFVPSGLGVRELTLSALLTSTLGMTTAVASAVALLSRALLLLTEVIFVAALSITAVFSRKRQ